MVSEYSLIFGLFKIDKDMFEEPENQRVFLDHEVPKEMIFFKVVSTWPCRGAF